MNNPRTVSDTKRAFYHNHARPINSIYRRVVEELLVEIHLLRVNQTFVYDPVFALGVVTTFERFMQGYHPPADQTSIFNAMCLAQELDPQQVQQNAQELLGRVRGQSLESLLDWISTAASLGGDAQQNHLRAIATNPSFKYSRLFAVGLFTLLEQAEPELGKDEARLLQVLQQVGEVIHLPVEKMQKDLEQYRSNLEKMTQARKTLEDIVAAERKRRQQNAAPDRSPESASATEAPN